MEIQKVRIPEIDLMRGFAIILVVLGHSFITNPVNIHDLSWGISLRHWIYTFHMELFFLVSGCVYHCSNYKSFVTKKIKRILVPYLIFGLISLLIHSLGLESVNGKTSIVEGIVQLLLYGGYYWFLYVLFIIFCVYPLLQKVFRTWYQEAALVAICLLLCFFVPSGSLFMIDSVLYHMSFFIFGSLISKTIPKIKDVSCKKAALLMLVSLALFFVLDQFQDSLGGGGKYYSFVRAITMIAFVFYCSVLLIKGESNGIIKHINSFLNLCSKYSLQIYLFNGFLMVLIRVLICNVFHITNPFIIVLSIVAGNLIFSLIACKAIKRSKILSFICGISSK